MANKKNDNAVITNYPECLCREHVSKFDGTLFRTIAFKFKDTWASFILPEEKITQSVKYNGDVIPERFNLDLGDIEDVRPVSVQTDSGEFERKLFFNRTIKSAIDDAKMEYKRSIAI